MNKMTNAMTLMVAMILFGLFGCASNAAVTDQAGSASDQPATQPKNTWVASPSAELPQGFPPPGPLGQVIIKQYPAHRSATVQAAGNGQKKQDANGMFSPLFKHIQRNDVAMSAPVEMTYNAPAAQAPDNTEITSMAFIYPEPTIGKAGPDGNVVVVDVPAMTVASVTVRGSYTTAHFQAGHELIQAWLKEHASDYEVAGPPRYMAYNSPFVLPMFKLGEVQVPIRAKSK